MAVDVLLDRDGLVVRAGGRDRLVEGRAIAALYGAGLALASVRIQCRRLFPGLNELPAHGRLRRFRQAISGGIGDDGSSGGCARDVRNSLRG